MLCRAWFGSAGLYWNGLALVRLDFAWLGSVEVIIVLLLYAGLSSAGPSWRRLGLAELVSAGLGPAEVGWGSLN